MIISKLTAQFGAQVDLAPFFCPLCPPCHLQFSWPRDALLKASEEVVVHWLHRAQELEIKIAYWVLLWKPNFHCQGLIAYIQVFKGLYLSERIMQERLAGSEARKHHLKWLPVGCSRNNQTTGKLVLLRLLANNSHLSQTRKFSLSWFVSFLPPQMDTMV